MFGRLDYTLTVPCTVKAAEHRTIVVIPGLLAGRAATAELVHRLHLQDRKSVV